jgi:outer membrane usher protein
MKGGIAIGLAVAMSAAAHAQDGKRADAPPPPAGPRQQPAIEINLPLTLDGRYLGDLPVQIDGSRAAFDASRFLELLRPELVPSSLAGIENRSIGGRLTPQAASGPDLTVRYDLAQQQIEVTTTLSIRSRRVIAMQGGLATTPAEVIAPANVSAFVNIGTDYQYVWENADPAQKGSQPIEGYFDVGGRVGGEKGVAFVSRQSFDTGGNHLVRRNETQLIYDDEQHLVRYTAGDLQYRGTSFQSLPRLAGVSVERYFGLEPNYVYRPIAQNQIELDSSATVEVQINGATIRELRLEPGRYDLRNLPLSQGANNVNIVIRDDTGRVQTLSSRSFFDIDLLGDGITDFSFAAGVRSRLGSGGISYSDKPAATGFILHGFSPTFTAGADVQADDRGATVGADAIWASSFGIWRAQAAVSDRRGVGAGYAANLGYRASGRLGQKSDWTWSADIDAVYYSPNFSTLSDYRLPAGVGARQPFSATVSADFQISSTRWSITGNGQYNRGRGLQGDTASALVGANYALTPRLTLGAFGTYTHSGGRSDLGALLQVTFRLGRKDLARGTYDTSRDEGYLSYRHSESNYVGDNSYEIGVRRNGQSDYGTITGNLFHSGNRFEATLEHDVFSTANLLSNDRIQTTRASIASSVVFADGKLSVGRPVQESFAIISPHPTLQGKTIHIDPSESGYRAKTDFLGAAVVPDVNAYGQTFLYYDVKDLPLGYDLGPGDFVLKPPLYSGYKLTVGSDATYTVLAHVTRDGEPVSLIAGQLQSLDRPDEAPVPAFTNRTGRLAATGLRPGRYRLELSTDPAFTTEVDIKADGSNLINLGDIRIPRQ